MDFPGKSQKIHRIEIFRMSKVSFQKNWFDVKGKDKMKNPEKNAVAKLGYTVTMIVVTTAILICMKKYKID